jgi:hypothetical protein
MTCSFETTSANDRTDRFPLKPSNLEIGELGTEEIKSYNFLRCI